jgi:hypothetical protein
MNEWMNGWMDVQMNEWIPDSSIDERRTGMREFILNLAPSVRWEREAVWQQSPSVSTFDPAVISTIPISAKKKGMRKNRQRRRRSSLFLALTVGGAKRVTPSILTNMFPGFSQGIGLVQGRCEGDQDHGIVLSIFCQAR